MTKAELDKKPLSELHGLAAEAGVERYRMLSRAELVAKLADGDGGAESAPARGRESGGRESKSGERAEGGERPARRRRSSRGGRRPAGERGEREGRDSGREPRRQRQSEPKPEPAAEPEPTPAPTPAADASSPESSDSSARPPRRRRRRRFGRRSKGELTLQGLLLPPAGRQALLTAESREGATALLRGLAAELSSDSKGVDPVALLIDPTPEELADWRRDAPKAEIVAAGQPRHASDALAQAQSRAAGGDAVILLVDSLTRLAEAYEDADAAREFFDAAGGNLTVVAALEKPAS